jgi:hypothetical protein
MIRIDPNCPANAGDYLYCEKCSLKYRRQWAAVWHDISTHNVVGVKHAAYNRFYKA